MKTTAKAIKFAAFVAFGPMVVVGVGGLVGFMCAATLQEVVVDLTSTEEELNKRYQRPRSNHEMLCSVA